MKFRKKPIVIDAIKWEPKNTPESALVDLHTYNKEFQYIYSPFFINKKELYIKTLEGDMHVSNGDWIIKGVHGELYPCKPDIFEKTYEKVED